MLSYLPGGGIHGKYSERQRNLGQIAVCLFICALYLQRSMLENTGALLQNSLMKIFSGQITLQQKSSEREYMCRTNMCLIFFQFSMSGNTEGLQQTNINSMNFFRAIIRKQWLYESKFLVRYSQILCMLSNVMHNIGVCFLSAFCLIELHLSLIMRKPVLCHMRMTRVQINLHIRLV